MTTGLTLRPMEPRDLPRIKRMWFELLQCGEEADPRFRPTTDAMEAIGPYAREMWVRRRPFPHGLVAEREEELLAFILGSPMHPVPVLQRPNTALITDIWVAKDARGSGLGRALVERFVGAAREAGYPVVEVNTLHGDQRAVAFWRSLGFGDWMVRLSREG